MQIEPPTLIAIPKFQGHPTTSKRREISFPRPSNFPNGWSFIDIILIKVISTQLVLVQNQFWLQLYLKADSFFLLVGCMWVCVWFRDCFVWNKSNLVFTFSVMQWCSHGWWPIARYSCFFPTSTYLLTHFLFVIWWVDIV